MRQTRCDWIFSAYGTGTTEILLATEREGWNALWRHLLCHTADVCRWWLGDALTVSADIDLQGGNGSGARQAGALANVIVTHERGQSVHHLARVRSTQSDERYKVLGAQGHLELILNPGASLVAGGAVSSLTRHVSGQRPESLATSERVTPDMDATAARYRLLLAHFADCVQTACAPLVRGADARAALEIVQAAYLSSQEGTKISLPLHRAAEPRALARPPRPSAALPPPDNMR